MQHQLNLHDEAKRCLLCQDAPCSKVCKNGDPARAIRAIRFENGDLAFRWLRNTTEEELQLAEKECIHYDLPIRIAEIGRMVKKQQIEQTDSVADSKPANEAKLPSLEITFCGIKCENPFFLASSAVCTNYEMIARAFDMGWAGVFYKTICLQEIKEVSPRFDAVSKPFIGFRNMEQLSEHPVKEDFAILKRLKEDYPNKVVIASIMGQTEKDWIDLARMAEEAGVDGVELNFSCPQMRLAGMGSDVGQNSELVAVYTSLVKKSVNIAVISKMTPNITHITSPAIGAYFAGADAISAINTIKSVTMSQGAEVSGKRTISGFSGRAIKPIALRHILEMAQSNILKNIELSGIGGIQTWRDALEFIQLGCNNVQVCTSVMQYGYRIIDDMILGLQNYMLKRGVNNLQELVGEEVKTFVTPHNLDRDTFIMPKINREKCIGCGRCYNSCQDGGHQAISFEPSDREPHIIGTKCVGCHLCLLVCPTGAIETSNRIAKKPLAAK